MTAPAISAHSAKVPRIYASTDRRVTPDELNHLRCQAGLSPQDPHKIAVGLEHSLLVVVARQVKSQAIAGCVRVIGDGVFSATVWDLVVDLTLPDSEAIKGLLIERLKREMKREYPKCPVSVFAYPQDWVSWQQAGFVSDTRGIRAMRLIGEFIKGIRGK